LVICEGGTTFVPTCPFSFDCSFLAEGSKREEREAKKDLREKLKKRKGEVFNFFFSVIFIFCFLVEQAERIETVRCFDVSAREKPFWLFVIE
jgi:hypothetical protein